MHLLFVSATPFEIRPLINHLEPEFEQVSAYHFKKENLEIEFLVTGVGIAYTAFSLGHVLAKRSFDWVVNAGIAGALNRNMHIGEVVNVVSERFGDLGVEEQDGGFTDVHELSLIDPAHPPFEDGVILNPGAAEFDFLPKAKGLTVNKVHGSQDSIDSLRSKYDADVESMEGAAFFLACRLAEMPFLEIRSISNYVEPRNRTAWDLPLAIQNLNEVLIELIEVFVVGES